MERDDSPRQRHGEGGPAPAERRVEDSRWPIVPRPQRQIRVMFGGSSMPGMRDRARTRVARPMARTRVARPMARTRVARPMARTRVARPMARTRVARF
jgi:hypothetical protein